MSAPITSELDYLRRAEPLADQTSKVNPQECDYYRRGESFDGAFLAAAGSFGTARRSFAVIIG